MNDGTERGIRVVVNNRELWARVSPRLLLVDFLRHDLALTGTHVGCEQGVCGACTVLLEGKAVRSCLLFAVQVDGCSIVTVEGLSQEDGKDGLAPLQRAFHGAHAVQCGFCTPGILMTLTELLKNHPGASEEDVREALSGNLCRCTGYQNILRATAAVTEGDH